MKHDLDAWAYILGRPVPEMAAHDDGEAPPRKTIWQRLGFGDRIPAPPEGDYLLNLRTVITIDWRDRLRILVTGRASLIMRLGVEEPVIGKIMSHSSFGVLPPVNGRHPQPGANSGQ